MVMLGCFLGSGGLPCSADEFWKITAQRMPSQLKEVNASAFSRGAEWGRRFHRGEGTP
jgi:Pyruvate/2-oxoacid:ferredoxin oxidoreductase gamma subunit